LPELEREKQLEQAGTQGVAFGAGPAKAVPVNVPDATQGQKRTRDEEEVEEEDDEDAEMEIDSGDDDSD
jgi:U2 small nuclear ribonucleoprotein B''